MIAMPGSIATASDGLIIVHSIVLKKLQFCEILAEPCLAKDTNKKSTQFLKISAAHYIFSLQKTMVKTESSTITTSGLKSFMA